MMWPLLELGGLHGDGDADEEDPEHGDGGVPLPVLGPAVGPARHAPYLRPEVTSRVRVPVLPSAAHRRLPQQIPPPRSPGALLALPPLTTLPGVRRLEEDDLCRSDAPKFEHQTQVTSCGMMFNMTVGAEVIRDVYVEKAVLAMDPSSDPGSTVVLLLLHDLAGLVYAKPGDQAWTVLPTPPGVDSFKDVVYHDGFFYGLSYNYEMVVTIDIFSGNRPIVEKYEQPVSEWTHCGGSYLVVAPFGDIEVILQVTRTTTRDSGPRRTVSFHVFAFVPGEVNKWVEVRALPGISLFLDGNCSTALYTSSVPGKSRSNCIYFGHDDRYPGYLHTTAFSDRDFGLFRLEDKAFERGFPAGVKMSTIKRPLWVMLSN